MADKLKVRGYGLRAHDTEVLHAIANQDFDGNDSEVIRQAIRHYAATRYPEIAARYEIKERIYAAPQIAAAATAR